MNYATLVQFCFDDDDEPEFVVVYCFEVQVVGHCQGQGLGEYLMNSLLSLSRFWRMQKLVCIVTTYDLFYFFIDIDIV
jgi:hypothetical protein